MKKFQSKIVGLKQRRVCSLQVTIRKAWVLWFIILRPMDYNRQTFTCSKSTLKALEKGVKYVKS